MLPEKKGLGVELWGSYQDVKQLYFVIMSFTDDESFQNREGFENRNQILWDFVKHLRKSYQGRRLQRDTDHFNLDPQKVFGVKISWLEMIFYLGCINYNSKFLRVSKFDSAMFLQLEYWLEKSMIDYDEKGGNELKNYINSLINYNSELLLQYYHFLDYEFFKLNGGKKSYRKLFEILRKAVASSDENKLFLSKLNKEAKILNCEIIDLLVYDDIDKFKMD
tara:strand:+ start:239 stop:901 length:663 start_codon:yes stop_codon:yes gene_type:complete